MIPEVSRLPGEILNQFLYYKTQDVGKKYGFYILNKCEAPMKKLVLLMVALLVLAGCAAKSGVVSNGPDTYLVSRQAATNFANLDNLKAKVLQEANEYCLSQNKNIRVVNTSVSPPDIMGNLPRATVQFMCLEKTDTDSPSP
jgi:hypothetical protein